MNLTKYILFANHTTTGSIYNTPEYDLDNARTARFFIEGPKAAGAAASWTVWFTHAARAGGTYMPFERVIAIGPGGGTVASASWKSSVTGSSNAAGTVICGYFDAFMPNSLKVNYEISGVASSASAGTMTGWLSVGEDYLCN